MCNCDKTKSLTISKKVTIWQLEEFPSNNLKVTTNVYKKQLLPVIKWNKKHLSKQVVSITYTMEENFYAAATFGIL